MKIKNASRNNVLETSKTNPRYHSNCERSFRHLFEVQQLLCTNAAYTGNAYWVMGLWGFRLRRDGYFCDSLSGSHHPRLSEKAVADSVFINAFK